MHLRTPLLVLAMLLPALGAFGYFIVFAHMPWANEVYAGVKIVMIALAMLGWRMSGRLFRDTLRRAAPRVLFGIVSGLVMAGIVALVSVIMQDILVLASEQLEAKFTVLMPLVWYIPATLIFSIANSLFEEWYWRGYVYGELARSISTGKAAFLAALAFTAHHVLVLSQLFSWPVALLASIGVFIGGIFWAYLFQKTSSLIPSWISHIFVDLAIFAVGYVLIF